tara:strand:+ start:212 stop:613 length:402 start_codon:yes stop_codon:yes gene_type:complete
MIKIDLKTYKNIFNLLTSEAEDMEIGISNILNSDLSNAALQVLVKSLPGRKRHLFIKSFLNQKSIENKKYDKDELRSQLIHDCLPWKELFELLKKQKLSTIDKKIIEHEICELYIKGIAEGKMVKSIKLELAW